MIYCLNPDCANPSNPDGNNFCQYCRTGLVSLLRDRYRIISLLGSGGFGRTFVAEDTDTPSQRRCVIKQLKPIANNPQIYQIVQERFQREAAILEELGEDKQQIPRLYAYFTVAGQFYLVQQWIDGETLTQKVQQQGLMGETTVKDILISLLPVLDYVHSRGIIHRDIKPDNIILRRQDGLPVLIDFGAVKETMGTVVTSQGTPTSSIVIGTPGYMPSEQAAGKPIRSSDLYSLGLTAIYGLTGKLPQEFPIDQDTGDILWHSTAVNFSREFVAVLDKTISWHPRERYSTANAMLNALQSGTAPIPPTIPSTQPSFPPTQPVQQQQVVPPTVSSPPPPVTPQHHTVKTQPAPVGWGFWFKWVLGNNVGFMLMNFVTLTLYQVLPQLGSVALGIFLIGLTQSIILQGLIARAWWWVPATFVGGMGGFLFGQSLTNSVVGAFAGMSAIGITQWIVLRGVVKEAWWWILATVVSFFVGIVITSNQLDYIVITSNQFAFTDKIANPDSSFLRSGFIGSAFGIISLYAPITGGVLVWRLRHRI